MKSENSIVVVIVLVALIAVVSLFFAFQSIEKIGNVVAGYKTMPGYAQKDFTVQEWTSHLESSPESKGRRTREAKPRLWYSYPGEYEEELKGNYGSGRFGGIVPKNTEYGKRLNLGIDE